MKRFMIALSFFVLLFPSIVIAETVYFKDGSKIQTNGVWKDGDKIGCFVDGEIKYFNASKIDKIDESKAIISGDSASKTERKESLFEKKAKKHFVSSILKSVNFYQGKGEILFKDPPNFPSYFRTGDKVNKVFAIESARLFREVPALEFLKMTIPLTEKTYVMNVSREAIEGFYGIEFSSMKGDLNSWRNNFIRRYDNKNIRDKFVAKFASSK